MLLLGLNGDVVGKGTAGVTSCVASTTVTDALLPASPSVACKLLATCGALISMFDCCLLADLSRSWLSSSPGSSNLATPSPTVGRQTGISRSNSSSRTHLAVHFPENANRPL